MTRDDEQRRHGIPVRRTPMTPVTTYRVTHGGITYQTTDPRDAEHASREGATVTASTRRDVV